MTESVVDIRVNMRFGAVLGEATTVYAILISDRNIQLVSDGKKMNIIT